MKKYRGEDLSISENLKSLPSKTFINGNRLGEDIQMGKEEEINKELLIPIPCHFLCMLNTRQPAPHHEGPSCHSFFLELHRKIPKHKAGFGGSVTDPVVFLSFRFATLPMGFSAEKEAGVCR